MFPHCVSYYLRLVVSCLLCFVLLSLLCFLWFVAPVCYSPVPHSTNQLWIVSRLRVQKEQISKGTTDALCDTNDKTTLSKDKGGWTRQRRTNVSVFVQPVFLTFSVSFWPVCLTFLPRFHRYKQFRRIKMKLYYWKAEHQQRQKITHQLPVKDRHGQEIQTHW